MIFDSFIKSHSAYFGSNNINMDPSTITLYPVGGSNLEGIKILIQTCKRLGSENSNVKIATIDPTLWLGKFLDKYWDKISFVSSQSEFHVLKIENNKIIDKQYRVESVEIEDEVGLDKFFDESKFKSLVLFSVVKTADLVKLTTSYKIRFSEISEKYEERDKKIKEVLG